MKLNLTPTLVSLGATTLWIASMGQAQETSEEPLYELSPFEVTTTNDRGYTATNSLAGGRLRSELQNTAASISVFTPELLADLGVTNFLEAAKWAPNAIPAEEIDGGNLYNDYSVNFRGLGLGFQSRNYFRWYINSDSYNTERIEFSRGPNSLVFGDAGVGGVGNVSSKQARGTNQVSLEGQWSSFGGYRTTLDVDYKLSDTFFVRTAILYQDFDDWRDVGGSEREGAFMTLTWRPTPKTSLRIEGEYGRLHRVITYNTLDRFSQWDGVTTNPGMLGRRDPVPNSLFRITTPRLVFRPGRPELGILDMKDYTETDGGPFGTGLLPYPQEGMPDYAVIPTRDFAFSLQVPDGGVRNPYTTASLFFNQQFGDNLYLELAANYQDQERDITRWFYDQIYVDVNETLPGDIPNPYLGDYYGWARYWNNQQSNLVYDYRASLAYILNTSLTEQRFLLVAGHRYDRFTDHNYELVRTNGSNPDVRNPTNRIFAWRYVSDGAIPNIEPDSLDSVSGIETGYAQTKGRYSEKPITYYQFAASGSWFKNRRLHTLVGIRRDHYEERGNDSSLDTLDPVTSELLEFGPRIKNDSQNITSYTLSGVYHISDQLGISIAYSKSFDPGTASFDINGNSMEPLLNSGKEVGLKYTLLHGRLNGSLVYYESEQENNRIGGPHQTINEIWTLIGSNESVQFGYQDRRTNSGSGWELEFTAMPTDNWRIALNFSIPDTEIEDGMSDTRSYYTGNVDTWISAANQLEADGETGTAAAVRNRIADVENAIESVTRGRKLDNSFDYTANFFTRYFFAEGLLKGFSLGGGANIRGKRLIGNVAGDPYDYIFADGYEIYSLLFGYEKDLKNGQISLQLNISNVLDDTIVRPGNLGFTVQDPRKYLLTLRFQF